MPYRLSIAAVMLWVLIAALAFAAIRSANETWSSLTLSTTLLLLGTSMLASCFSAGSTRAFASGAALFGLGYLALALGPWTSTEIAPHLATSQLLQIVQPRLISPSNNSSLTLTYAYITTTSPVVATAPPAPNPPPPVSFPSAPPAPATAPFTITLAGLPSEEFLRVGHSLFALAFALLGGLIARYFHARSAHPSLPVPHDGETRSRAVPTIPPPDGVTTPAPVTMMLSSDR